MPIHSRHLAGKRVYFSDPIVDRLAGLSIDALQLGRQLAKARCETICIAQKLCSHNVGCGINRQLTCRTKKFIQRWWKTHRIATHNIDYAIGIIDHRTLRIHLTGAVAQILLKKLVIRPLNTRHAHAGAKINLALLARHVLGHRGFLTHIAFGTHVGDVVGDRAQRALISGDGAAANGEHVTHYSAPVSGTGATRPGLIVNLSGRTSGNDDCVRCTAMPS